MREGNLMNKGVKALVKHEMRPTFYACVYFMIIVLGAIYFTNSLYQLNYETYMVSSSDWALNMQSIQIPMVMYKYVLLFFSIGILIITFMMFKEGKNTETNRFLKSLPYSHYHYLIKLVMGALSYTVPFILLVIAFIGFKVKHQVFFEEIQSINLIGEALKSTDTIGHLLVLSLMYYLILTTWYLFLMMMQYLWNNAIGANVVGILIWVAPVFIFFTTILVYEIEYSWRLDFLNQEDVLMYLNPFIYGVQKMITANYGPSSMQPNEYVSILLYPSIKMMILVGLCLIFLWIIYQLNQKRHIEKVYYLVPSKGFRILFRIGVGTCSMLLFGVLTKEIFLSRLDVGFGVFQVLMIVAGLVGGFIAYKISCIGIEKK